MLDNAFGSPETTRSGLAVSVVYEEELARMFTSLTHSDPSALLLTGLSGATGTPATTMYSGTINAPTGAFDGEYFTVSGFPGPHRRHRVLPVLRQHADHRHPRQPERPGVRPGPPGPPSATSA